MPAGPGPSRRTVLGAAALTAVIALPALCGCSGDDPVRAAAPGLDVVVLSGAIAAEQDLIARYEAARAAHTSLAKRIDPAIAHHREHLGVLRRHYVPGSGRQATDAPATSTSPSPQRVPDVQAKALASLRTAEIQTAARYAADAGKSAPGLAQLLASIGACAAGHGASSTSGVAKKPMTQPSTASLPPARGFTLEALQAALASEHAAVYGYGVLGSRLSGGQYEVAQTYWNAHRVQRDSLMALLTARQAKPVAAAAAYRLPVRVTSTRTAAQLATRLEDDLTVAYVGLAGAQDAQLREQAARAAQESMTSAVRWRTTGDLPLTHPAFPGLPASALSPRPRPGH
ncbi:ferritin-like domain-containing protein [Spirillospora sp. NPDC048911]|uniref:ferritin-like domain-containing protein n=1 Tax=Spirillospora sp. NPDC048911 TaxID=3364527 RepID=UPI00371E49FC